MEDGIGLRKPGKTRLDTRGGVNEEEMVVWRQNLSCKSLGHSPP